MNKIDYIKKYNKEHYVQVKIDISKEQKQDLIDICKKQNISVRQFILNAIERAKKE